MLKLLVVIAIGYLVVMAITYFNQRSLIYQPSKRGLTETEAQSLGMQKWPATGDYRGYLVDNGNVDKTFVLFHGNAGEAADRLHYLPPFTRENARVILAEYPGFGARSGLPSESLFVPDSIETLAQVSANFPDEPIYVFGESLGSGIASASVGTILAEQSAIARQITGLGLITPFDSLVNVAQQRFRYLPVRWLIKDHYNSAVNLRHVNIPKALILSGQDLVVPIKHGQSLARQLVELKRSFTIDPAGHSNWMTFIDSDWWDRYFDFLLQRRNP